MGNAESDAAAEKLYCLACGYNLRGLSGDPRRCPECGNENALADLRLPAALIADHLRKLETLPTLCVAAMFGTGCGWLLTRWAGGMPGGYCLMVPAVFAWPWLVYGFGRRCRFRFGWLAVLGQYHVAGLAFLLPVALLMAVDGLVGNPGGGLLVVAVVCMILIAPPCKRAYNHAKEKLDVFCRGIAVDLAKQELRRYGRR